jgi:hypothetical protein
MEELKLMLTPQERLNKFKHELKELLIKYDASISANVGKGSDTHGIYDEYISISVRDNPKLYMETSESADGWCLDQQNIDELKPTTKDT